MGHQGQPLQGVVGILQLQVAVAIGEGGKNLLKWPPTAVKASMKASWRRVATVSIRSSSSSRSLLSTSSRSLSSASRCSRAQFLQRQHVHRLQRLMR